MKVKIKNKIIELDDQDVWLIGESLKVNIAKRKDERFYRTIVPANVYDAHIKDLEVLRERLNVPLTKKELSKIPKF